MLVTGYLKVTRREVVDGKYICKVAIPNKELRTVYKKEILAKLDKVMPPTIVDSIHSAICDNNVESALNQIETKLYDTEMKMRDVQEIVKYGVAFCGKQVEVATC